MEIIKDEFKLRCSDINVFHKHIVDISESKRTIKISSILKSSLFIALYNNVEATFYSIFERIHYDANKLDYNLLSDNLKIKIKLFYFKSKDIPDENCMQLKFPLLKDFLKKHTLFSGNLDARKGKALFRTYGIGFDKNFEISKLNSLVTIKNKRNKIAHGELTLPDAGKNTSHQTLRGVIDNSNEVLEEFINCATTFLAADGYLSQLGD